MTLAEKIRQCTDEQLAKLILEIKDTIVTVEMDTEKDMTPQVMERILQKPFIPPEVRDWLETLENAKP